MTTDPAPAQPPVRRGRGRWLRIALVASLATNFLVIGAVGGSLWVLRHGGPPPPGGIAGNVVAFTATLSGERRRALIQATSEERKGLRPHRAELIRARMEVARALTAEPFDKERLAAALREAQATEVRAREAFNRLFITASERMTPDERRAFARWRDRGERGRGGSGRGDDAHPGRGPAPPPGPPAPAPPK